MATLYLRRHGRADSWPARHCSVLCYRPRSSSLVHLPDGLAMMATFLYDTWYGRGNGCRVSPMCRVKQNTRSFERLPLQRLGDRHVSQILEMWSQRLCYGCQDLILVNVSCRRINTCQRRSLLASHHTIGRQQPAERNMTGPA